MAKVVTELYCDSCKTGIVKLIVSSTKGGVISAKVTNCSRCKRGYGLHGIQELQQVKPPIAL
jgi:hypothetical protein